MDSKILIKEIWNKLKKIGKLQYYVINDVTEISGKDVISISNLIFISEIWDRFTKFAFWNFWNLLSKTAFKISKKEQG